MQCFPRALLKHILIIVQVIVNIVGITRNWFRYSHYIKDPLNRKFKEETVFTAGKSSWQSWNLTLFY